MKINLVVIYTFVACLYLSQAIEVDITADINADVDRRKKKSHSKYHQFRGKTGLKHTKSIRNKSDPESANFRSNLGSDYYEGCDSYTKKTDFYVEMIKFTWIDIECYCLTGGDGYYLQLIRLKLKAPIADKLNQPLHLVHNWGASSDVWTYREDSTLTSTGTPVSAGIHLVKLGYDVWMSNMRGNGYSESHETYDQYCEEFWDFSWGDIGYWDLPLEWELIEEITSKKPIPLGNGMGAQAIAAAIGAFENYSSTNDPKLVDGVILVNLITNMVKDGSCAVADRDECNKIYSDALGNADDLESTTLYNSLQCNGFLVQGIDKTDDDTYRSVRRCHNQSELSSLENFFITQVADQYVAINAPASDLFTPIVAKATSKEVVNRLQNAKPSSSNWGKFSEFDEGTSSRNQWIYDTNSPPIYQGIDLDNYKVAFFGGYSTPSSGRTEIGPRDNAREYCKDAKNVWKFDATKHYVQYGANLMDLYYLPDTSGVLAAWTSIVEAIDDIRLDDTSEFGSPGTCEVEFV